MTCFRDLARDIAAFSHPQQWTLCQLHTRCVEWANSCEWRRMGEVRGVLQCCNHETLLLPFIFRIFGFCIEEHVLVRVRACTLFARNTVKLAKSELFCARGVLYGEAVDYCGSSCNHGYTAPSTNVSHLQSANDEALPPAPRTPLPATLRVAPPTTSQHG
jgi:hypothetical protein